jgi:L-glutamine:2-deoxy-scyllo-inosose/3-amino-2,3-dideoxy-scyllo-inosose aminotransferase
VDDVNGEPVLLDIDPATNTLDPNVVEAYLEDCLETGKPMPRAIIVVHLHDHAADMDRFPGIARRFGLFLIEDCAQAHGAAWRDRALGSFGTLGTFSTQRTKPLAGVKRADDDRWECPTGSEGGFVVTGVPLLDIRVRSGADCGRRVEESVLDPAADVDELTDHWRTSVDALNLGSKVESGNNRLPASVAERLLDQMDWFEQEHQERTATLKALDRRLPEFVGVSLLAHQPQLTRRVTHMFAMRFEPEEFAGMDSELFRQVLMPLLGGLLVDKPYDTLGGGEPGYRSPVYDPHAMRRYNTTPEHWEAIDPSRAHLPACHDAMKHVVVIENTALREPGFPDALVAALQWMRRRAAWLVEQARA